jgi:DNA polymerase-4
MPYLCRDCLSESLTPGSCAGCSGTRIIGHAELHSLTIAHLDCDAFYASIEIRDDPNLLGKPVLVGGRHRGVVAACSYEARRFGIHSAMPMFEALKRCPEAVVIAPDMAKYTAAGRQVRRLMGALTPLVEPLSIDEAFLDLGGTEKIHGGSPARTLAALALRIKAEVGITASIGLSYNKFLAKVASDLDKPDGFAVIGRAEARDFLGRQPASLLWGVGKAMQKRLADDGLDRIAALQAVPEAELAARYGAIGARIARFVRGEDERRVDPSSVRKSLSAETTLDHDLAALEELSPILWALTEKVARGLKAESLAGRTVTLKLKTARFRLLTRSRTLADPTRSAEMIYRTVQPLLRGEAVGPAFRLIGVGVSGFAPLEETEAGLFDFADPDAQARAKLEDAVDDLRDRFGTQVIGKGRGLKH